MKESIIIVSQSRETAEKIRTIIAPHDCRLHLKTKYYTVSVPVVIATSLPNPLGSSVKGIVLIDEVSMINAHSLTCSSDDDCVKIFLSRNEAHLDACIDAGFELVTYSDLSDISDPDSGVGRLVEALKCRLWQSEEPSTCSEVSPEKPMEDYLDSFESLISEMQNLRNASAKLSDSERRARAEQVATRLSKFLCDDSDDDDIQSSN